MKLLTMTLAGLLPVRKIKAGITMSCPVRECHVVFVRSESSHLNSSNQKQYEKKVSKYVSGSKVFSLSHWISHRASTNIVCVVHVDTNLPMLVSWELDVTENYVVFFNRKISSPIIFFVKSHLEGNCEAADWSLSDRCRWDYVEDCSANPLKCLNLTIFHMTSCWSFIAWYIIYRIYPNRLWVLYLKASPE